MGKPNTYVQLLNAQRELRELRQNMDLMKAFTIQQCEDMACIALNQEFGFGPKYCQRFKAAFMKIFVDYAELCVNDGKDDAEISYTKGKVDRALRAACGEDTLEFDERYAPERLYFRDRIEKGEKDEL